MLKTTQQHANYWKNRKIDWRQSYSSTWNHPHRELIIDKLRRLNFGSLFEVGCASGPNLYRISKEFPQVQIGGMDVSEDAISTAKSSFKPFTELQVGNAVNGIFLSDKSVDVLLTDMALIYISPSKIRKVLREIKRVGRSYVIFSEFHSGNVFKRWALALASGYFAHNYLKLLEQEGFWDIELEKIKEKDWEGEPQKTYGYIISAKI